MLEASKPGTFVQIGFANEDGTKISFIHIFPSSQAKEDHMVGVGDRTNKTAEFLDAIGYEIYGSPSEQIIKAMEQFTGSGVTLTVWPDYFGGFMRLQNP